MTGQLSARLLQFCEDVASGADGALAPLVQDISARLDQPLVVAVAGRIKAGKSTLVNTLVGRRVAPTGAGETTRLVTRFQYGTPDRYELVFKSGAREAHPLRRDQHVPSNLQVDADEVAHIDVWLSNELLRDMTIVDTPGLESLNVEVSARTEDFLGIDNEERASGEAAADAVLFVFNSVLRSDERDTIRAFNEALGSVPHSRANTLGVLTKADLVGSADDPWPDARRLAAAHAQSLGADVADVLPVSTLIAETIRSGDFTEDDAATLRRVADLDDATRARLVLSADRFLTLDAPVAPEARAGLLERLDLYGIRAALAAIDRGVTAAAALEATLLDLSGFGAVQQAVAGVFARRADALKAAAAIRRLRRVAHDNRTDAAQRRWLADELESLLLEPAMHALALLDVEVEVLSGAVELPFDLRADVIRFASGDQSRDVEHALQRAQHWKSYGFSASAKQRWVADVMHRAYHLLWEELLEEPGLTAEGAR